MLRVFDFTPMRAGGSHDNIRHSLLHWSGIGQTSLPLVFGATPGFSTVYASGIWTKSAIWNVARTQAEIAESRFCRLTGAEAGLTVIGIR